MAKKKKFPKIVQQIRDYKPPFINFGVEKIISHTQMTVFNTCNFRWGLYYRDKNKHYDPSISLVFGTAIHEVLQTYLQEYYDTTKASADRLDLETMFKDKLRHLYLKDYKKNNNVHFSDVEELDEHCIDGLEIIRYFKKKVSGHFSKKGWYLGGIEVPITYTVLPNVMYKGSLDIVLYHEPTNTIEIVDIKTSTHGWGKWQKKDEIKLSQLILYKKLFSEQFGFPIENIKIKFFIVKRKINEESEYVSKRIQEFIPASGKSKQNRSIAILKEFLDEGFQKDGSYNPKKFKKNITKFSCDFCPFKDNDELCNKNNPNLKWKSPFDVY